jgi:hypothetical protein
MQSFKDCVSDFFLGGGGGVVVAPPVPFEWEGLVVLQPVWAFGEE